jgi:DNA end-binding protein Ku
VENAPLARPDILKGYEIARDQYVVFDPAEVAALRPRTSTEIEITEFVKPAEIDPVYYDASYYVAADRGGEKPYALLYRALSESGYAAIGALAMHGREYFAAIRPGSRGLMLHTLFHANEIGKEEEYAADPALVPSKELEMAKLLVSALAAKFDPSRLKDPLEERLKQLVESRAKVGAVPGASRTAAQPAPVIDIMEALRKSLEAARKPVASETSSPGARKRPNRRAK